MIKLCVVGGGYWGENHLKTLHELGFLAGLVDIENSKRDKAKKKKKYQSLLFRRRIQNVSL